MSLRVSISIATHNRREDLIHTLSVLTKLDPQPYEIRITADGCTDGTVEYLREHHAEIPLTVNAIARGSTGSRDTMFREARGEIILILDDDSHPVESDFLRHLPRFFEENPRLAVIHFPQRSDEFPESLTATNFGPSKFVGTYVNCAAAMRREAFIAMGGYPEQFRIAYDEPDFALRCICAGWQVRYETSHTIRHHYSGVQRNELRMHHTHARNELWSVFMRCPALPLPAVASFRIARQFGYAMKRGLRWVLREPVWWWNCIRGIPRCLRERAPVPWQRYRAWMELVRHPISVDAEYPAVFGVPSHVSPKSGAEPVQTA